MTPKKSSTSSTLPSVIKPTIKVVEAVEEEAVEEEMEEEEAVAVVVEVV